MFGALSGEADDDDGETDDFSSPGPFRSLPRHWHEVWVQIMDMREARRWGGPECPLYQLGHFEAISLIGVGGCGIVFKVRDPNLDREVALKVCLTRGPIAARRIKSEAQLIAKVSHPNVITVHEIGEIDGEVYFVMELVLGSDGRPYLASKLVGKNPSWCDAVDIYSKAGRGLAAAHAKDIVHGDFKPNNILIDEAGRPRVTDFGLAQVFATEQVNDDLEYRLGTRPYMAPEVLRGEVGDPLSDQWSFCVALWETIEGELPYLGANSEQLLDAIANSEPITSDKPVDVPPELRALLRKGLSVDPRERYPDMETLLDALEQIRERAAGDRPEATLGARPVANGRPHGGILVFLGIGGVSCVLFGLLLATIVFRGRTDSHTPPTRIDTVTEGTHDAIDAEIEAALEETLELIEKGKFEDADRRWSDEDSKRDELELLELPALEIASAFLGRAIALEDQQDLERAKVAGAFAFKWALAAKSDPSETNTPAAAVFDEAVSLLARLGEQPSQSK